MSERLTKEDLIAVWRRDMDPSYTQPLEDENGGRGLDPIAGLAAVLERCSTAVLNSTQALYLKPHSRQLAPPASGAVKGTGEVEIYRRRMVGGPIPLDDGDQIIVQALGVDGEPENAPVLEVIGDVTIPSGTEGPTVINVRAARPGFQGNVKAGLEGKFLDRRGGEFVVVSLAGSIVTIDPVAGDKFLPTMDGMFWVFTDGPNVGAYARRITPLTSTTGDIDASAGLIAQGAGHGRVVDFQEVGDFRIVTRDVTGGRSGELDMLAGERTKIGRAIDEDDDEFRARIAKLPDDVITPNALIRSIAAVLDPEGIPFTFLEVFEVGAGMFWSGDGPGDLVDVAYTDPTAYAHGNFYTAVRGFIVIINGGLIPAEPERTRILAALTTTIVATKGYGVPWAIAFEPPIP